MPTETIAERVRRKLLAEIHRQKLSQRDLGSLLGWSQARVARVLNGRQELLVEDVGALCTILNARFGELVRDEGYEFCADLTPTELRLVESYRQRPDPVKEAINILLDVRPPKAASNFTKTAKLGTPRPR